MKEERVCEGRDGGGGKDRSGTRDGGTSDGGIVNGGGTDGTARGGGSTGSVVARVLEATAVASMVVAA